MAFIYLWVMKLNGCWSWIEEAAGEHEGIHGEYYSIASGCENSIKDPIQDIAKLYHIYGIMHQVAGKLLVCIVVKMGITNRIEL